MNENVKENEYITCRELIGFLADYIAGALTPEMTREFKRHLAACPSCVAYVESYRRTVSLARSANGADDEAARATIPDALVQAIKAARTKGQ